MVIQICLKNYSADRTGYKKATELMNPSYALGILMIFQEHAKMGGQLENFKKMQQFRNMINSCRFIDLGFNGPKFTWCNKIDPHVCIQESLDRSLANIEWITLYDEYKVQHLDLIGSDHRPILLDSAPNIRPKRNFQFQAMQTRHESFLDLIQSSWTDHERVSSLHNLCRKMQICKENLIKCNKNIFGHIASEIP